MSHTTIISVGPQDRGRLMTLDEFDLAEGQPGYNYELSRGVVTVVDVPNRPHLAQINAIRRQFSAYDITHQGQIHTMAAGGECKLLIIDLDSERHPDISIYTAPPTNEQQLWSTWIPAIVIEVISPGSE